MATRSAEPVTSTMSFLRHRQRNMLFILPVKSPLYCPSLAPRPREYPNYIPCRRVFGRSPVEELRNASIGRPQRSPSITVTARLRKGLSHADRKKPKLRVSDISLPLQRDLDSNGSKKSYLPLTPLEPSVRSRPELIWLLLSVRWL